MLSLPRALGQAEQVMRVPPGAVLKPVWKVTRSEDSLELPAVEYPRKKRVRPSRLNICREKQRVWRGMG